MAKSSSLPKRPEALSVDPDGIPKELKSRNVWLVWAYEYRPSDQEWTKVPKHGNNGHKVNATDPDNGVAFETAYETYANGDYDGVGVIMAPGNLLVGFDWDDCRRPEQSENGVPEVVEDGIATLNSYTEISPSENGFRSFAFGVKPDVGSRADLPCEPICGGDPPHIEVYDGSGGRYLTVTGQHVEKTPKGVEKRPQEIKELCSEYLEDDTDTNETTDQSSAAPKLDLDDETVLKRARSAENGEKFKRLENGFDGHHGGDTSKADKAFCQMLAFWTGGDRSQMDRLFRNSGRMRGKWDEVHSSDGKTYGEMTIEAALSDQAEFYNPENGQEPHANSGDNADTEKDNSVTEKFITACEEYQIDSGRVAKQSSGDGDTVVVGVGDVVADYDIGDAILVFNRTADLLDGTDRQNVVGHVVYLDLQERGEFFKTPLGELYYFSDDTTEVFRVDSDGRRTLTEEFQGMVWDRYNLAAGKFSRNLGEDLKTKAKYYAPEREAYQFAHYDDDKGELYVSDFDDGYYAVSSDGIEWRANGSDVYFLTETYGEPYEYLEPTERPSLPDELAGEREKWKGNGDPLMRMFGNRVNYDESAALGPMDQRNQLYLYIHTLPFLDAIDARPIMAWVGPKGSGKTVAQRSIGQFIYGPDYTESAMPENKRDFLAKAVNQPLAFVDNYDEEVQWANDVLASIATGTGVDIRQYFTGLGLEQRQPRCWISFTSRDPPTRRDDVADRTLVFRAARVSSGFVPMGDYLHEVAEYRNLLWSTYLDNLQDILGKHTNREIGQSSTHRMADWANFARRVANALDVNNIDELLESIQTERATFALENEQWAFVLGEWVSSCPEEASEPQTAGDIGERLKEVADDKNMSIDTTKASGLGYKLTDYRSELSELYNLEVIEHTSPKKYRFDVDDDTIQGGLGRFQ